jgi:hypothetical protein
MRTFLLPLLISVAALPVAAQIMLTPDAASTRLYFAQLADGGSADQRWTTTLTLVNPDTLAAANVVVSFYSDSGQPLPLDFGAGPKPTFALSVAPGGAASITSLGAGATMVVGWGVAASNVPVLGTVIYRAWQGSKPVLDVAASGAGSTYSYSAAANRDLGIALANPSATQSMRVTVAARDQTGNDAGNKVFTLVPMGHTAFNLGGQIGNLPGTFSGSITVASADNPPAPFVAWTVNSRDGLLAPLPAGESLLPPSGDRRAFDVAARLRAAAAPLIRELARDPRNFTHVTPDKVLADFRRMDLSIDGDSVAKAEFVQSDFKIHLSRPLLEMLAGSDAAQAFLIAREAARGESEWLGLSVADVAINVSDPVGSLDGMAAALATMAGYDPMGLVDFWGRLIYGKMEGVPTAPALLTEYGVSDTLDRVGDRLGTVIRYTPVVCAYTQVFAQSCQALHNLWHPHFPSQVP